MMKTKIILLIATTTLLFSCSTKGQKNNDQTSNKNQTEINSDNEEHIDDDYTGDKENRSYQLGTVTFTAEDNTITISKFGIDPYTAMTWFTPESGVEPMANVVFKSDDFKNTAMVNLQDFDAMQTDFQGEKKIINSSLIVSFVADDVTYMFSEGTVTYENFSRKTGKVKLKVEGKCNKSVLTKPEELKTDVPATLEIDAYIPFSNVDGTTHKTEAADNFKVHKP